MKRALIILINKFVYFIGKMIGKGSSYPGKLALKLDKDILKKIKLPENIIMVTGTNGKTTTVGMICKVLKENGYSVGCNNEGANLTEGVTTMILNCCNLKGEVKKDVLVIESDERFTRHTVKYIKPKYLVVTNLYRDQMTRAGHSEHIYNILNDAISDDIHLILNTDDPLSSLYGYKRDNTTYFGMNRNQLSTENDDCATNEAIYCPNCKQKLIYEYYHFNHIGKYICEKCGHERKNPQYVITKLDLNNGNILINDNYEMGITLRSIYNAYNLVACFAVCDLLGIKKECITNSLNNYVINNGRVKKFNINKTEGMALLSKHETPVCYNQSLRFVKNENKRCSLLFMIDNVSRRYFTTSTYWLWDVDFELINSENIDRIYLTGRYAYDIALRFEYTKIPKEKIIIETDVGKIIDIIKENKDEFIYTITCFLDTKNFFKILKEKEKK